MSWNGRSGGMSKDSAMSRSSGGRAKMAGPSGDVPSAHPAVSKWRSVGSSDMSKSDRDFDDATESRGASPARDRTRAFASSDLLGDGDVPIRRVDARGEVRRQEGTCGGGKIAIAGESPPTRRHERWQLVRIPAEREGLADARDGGS